MIDSKRLILPFIQTFFIIIVILCHSLIFMVHLANSFLITLAHIRVGILCIILLVAFIFLIVFWIAVSPTWSIKLIQMLFAVLRTMSAYFMT